jgi:TetR/AcrR family transcriptional regulator, transcriptional repressor for nem operon
MSNPTTRERIAEAADDLFYRQGFAHTSFSDIADAVHISRGNFYHHFKSKDDILDAVIARRLEGTRAMLEQWETDGETPAERIRSFIHMMVSNRDKIMAYGCPVGTLCSELAKLDHGAQGEAKTLFTLFRAWLAGQFRLLGRERDADALAMHLLARSQGIATLANAFHDEAFIEREIMRLDAWLGSIAATAAH